jgi:hypothetical protein
MITDDSEDGIVLDDRRNLVCRRWSLGPRSNTSVVLAVGELGELHHLGHNGHDRAKMASTKTSRVRGSQGNVYGEKSNGKTCHVRMAATSPIADRPVWQTDLNQAASYPR